MADNRQYPGMQQNYNPQLLHQQQQQHQQHMMNQLDSQPSPSSFPTTQENARIWQQQMQHLSGQPQFRSQSGPDAQMNQQMDSLRNQNHSRNGQQQFVGGNNTQSFPDQHNQGFNPMNMAGQPMNREMMQSLQNNPQANPMSRQIQLMSLAQNQSQHTSFSASRMMQQQQAAQQANLAAQAAGGTHRLSPPQTEQLFAPPALSAENMRRSPLPPGQAQMPGPPQAAQTRRSMTLPELREHANKLRSVIHQEEQTLAAMSNNRAGTSDAVFLPKIAELKQSITAKQDYLRRIFIAMQNMQTGNTTQNPNMPPAQNQQAVPGMHNASMSSQAWMNQQQQMGLSMNTQTNNHLNGPPNPNVPPRATHTPQQQPHPGQFANQNPGNTFPFVPGATNNLNQRQPNPQDARTVQNLQNQLFQSNVIPPLEKERFTPVYTSFCKQKGITPDARILQVENRPIDLHKLHTEVFREGGALKVSQHELWTVIGGRLGFVQFPGSDTEPAKSGPGVAQHLAHVYKEYLAAFDLVYVNSIQELKRKQIVNPLQQQQQQQQQQQHLNRNVHPAQAVNSRPLGFGNMTSTQMQAVTMYANISVAELRNKKVPENLIQFVEQNRAQLQRTMSDHISFREDLRPHQPGEMNRVISNSAPSQHSEQYPAAAFPHQAPPPGGERRVPPAFNPSSEQMQQAMAFIHRHKAEFNDGTILNLRTHQIPDNQRQQFNTLLENIYRMAVEVEPNLPLYYVLLKQDDMVKKMIAISLTAYRQRQLLSASTPTFVLTIEMLKNMLVQMQQASDLFQATFKQVMSSKAAQMAAANNNLPPGSRPQAPPGQQQMPQMPAGFLGPSRQPLTLPPGRRKNAASAGSPASHPTPPASTPAAPSPMAAPSPQTPKSPPKKISAKKAPIKRRPSNANVKPAPTPPATSSSPALSQKRAREEDVPFDIPNDPSPKRVKTEWETPSAAGPSIVKREEEVENIKTEEDASQFLERMTELIKMAAAGGEGQEALTSGISDTLDIILKGYGGVPDSQEAAEPSLDLNDFTNLDSAPMPDEFNAFFDFSGCTAQDEDDNDSKPPTPELVSSSSTNPSPESGSETDIGHGSAPDHRSDFAKESVWKEIDGGESQYYNNSDWKWDGIAPSLDPAWAIFPSS